MHNKSQQPAAPQSVAPLIIRNLLQLGPLPYPAVWHAMRQFTLNRDASCYDEIWLLEHQPCYTLGRAGRPEHLLNPNTQIPLWRCDRGGQITYHGPGQLMIYTLLDIKRLNLGIRQLVTALEQTIIQQCAYYNINAYAQPKAPGVYVQQDKLAAVGLRVVHGRCYHGIAINMQLDLRPFAHINPCGYAQLETTSWHQLAPSLQWTAPGSDQQALWLRALSQMLLNTFAHSQHESSCEPHPLLGEYLHLETLDALPTEPLLCQPHYATI